MNKNIFFTCDNTLYQIWKNSSMVWLYMALDAENSALDSKKLINFVISRRSAKLHLLLISLLSFITQPVLAQQALSSVQDPCTVTVYFVRHADKDTSDKVDPELTNKGRARAEHWAKVFSSEKLSAVYSTKTRRTEQTAGPIAEQHNLPIHSYEWRLLSIENLYRAHCDGVVVVVGHSNTIAATVNRWLHAEKYEEIDESSYDQLFIVNGRQETNKMLLTTNHIHVPLN